MVKRFSLSIHLLVIFLFLVLDQFSKWFFRSHSYEVIPAVFSFSPSVNAGSAFGLFQWIPNWVFIILSLLVVIGGSVLVVRKDVSLIPGVLFLSGVLGNLVDRIMFGAVTDFISFSFWPSFNVADSLMVLGVVLFILEEFFGWGKKKRKGSYVAS